MPKRRNVYIPLIDQGAGDGAANHQLLHIYSEPSALGIAPNIAKGFDLVVVNLRKIGLYQSGCIAANAVRTLDLKKPWCALHQWLWPQAWIEKQCLYANGIKIIGGGSAELGMALVLLMGGSNSPYDKVIATGRLSNKIAVDSRDTGVEPIGYLKDKLKLLLREFSKNKENILCFIPELVAPENPVSVEPDAEIKNLREQLSQKYIQVIPVKSLSEAAKHLRADKADYTLWDQLLKWLVCFILPAFLVILVTLCVGSLGYAWWQVHSLEMQFIPGDQITAPEDKPFLTCFTHQGQSLAALPEERGFVPLLPVENTLGWRVRLGSYDGMDAFLHRYFGFEGYYVAMVSVSEFSPTHILTATDENHQPLRIVPGTLWEQVWVFELPKGKDTEINTLILLAQRHAPFNIDKIYKSLETAQANSTGKNLSKTIAFIKSLVPGTIEFPFKIVQGNSKCDKNWKPLKQNWGIFYTEI